MKEQNKRCNFNIYNTTYFLFFAMLLIAMNNVSAQIKVPSVLSNGMVLQQQSNVPIWGWSAPGEKISVSSSWSKQKIKVKANNFGKWKIIMATPKAGGPYTLTIKGNSNSITIKDVLIGEVWVCSGQSNMVFRMSNSDTYKADLDNLEYPNIRYFEVKRQVSEIPQEDALGSKWETINAETASPYSAAAIYFAIKLQKKLNVPVGLIEAAWGGTTIDNWTPLETLKNDDLLSKSIKRWEDWGKEFKGDSIGYHYTMEAYNKKEISKKPSMPSSIYMNNRPHRLPSGLYNGLIAPITQYKIKGVLWYQGESNRNYSEEYALNFDKMITAWRNAWQYHFPFYFVQIAPFKGNADGVSEIMEAQLEVMKFAKNVGMVVTMDVGNMDDIHPTEKKPVGERLANWALSQTYGVKDIDYSGPIFKEYTKEKNHIKLHFDYAASGLKADGDVKGFEVIEFNSNGAKKPAKPLAVNIDGTDLVISTENLVSPFILRYGWGLNMGNTNLFDKEGLPASPFRILVK